MKSETTQHIFYIHSNITLLAALATIQHLGVINATFLYGRGFKSDFIKVPCREVHLSIEMNRLIEIPTYGSSFLAISHFRTLKAIDKILKSEGNGNFTLYLPNTKNYLMQFMLTNKGCQSFSILEEGLVIFMGISHIIKQTNPYYQTTFIGRIKKNLKFFNHATRTQYYYNPTTYLNKIYLFFNPEKYSDIDKAKMELIKWPKIKQTLPDYSNSKIFVFDNTVGEKITDIETNLKIINIIFQEFTGNKILIKFHPAQLDTKEIIQALDNKSIQFEVIDNSIPLELVFLHSKKIKVYGLLSSLLFYAIAAGHQSFSFIRYAEKEDKEISSWVHLNMPPIFFEKVEII